MRRSSESRRQIQQSVATGVEAAQQGPDEALRQALVASSAGNVKLRVDVFCEDSTGASSRMEDVLSSKQRGSEEMCSPDDSNLTPNDESMGVSEIAVTLLSLGVAPANFKVAELFCRITFGDAAP